MGIKSLGLAVLAMNIVVATVQYLWGKSVEPEDDKENNVVFDMEKMCDYFLTGATFASYIVLIFIFNEAMMLLAGRFFEKNVKNCQNVSSKSSYWFCHYIYLHVYHIGCCIEYYNNIWQHK